MPRRPSRWLRLQHVAVIRRSFRSAQGWECPEAFEAYAHPIGNDASHCAAFNGESYEEVFFTIARSAAGFDAALDGFDDGVGGLGSHRGTGPGSVVRGESLRLRNTERVPYFAGDG